MDATYLFTKNFINIKYEDLPICIIEATKKEVLNLLGVAMAGSFQSGVKELMGIVTNLGVRKKIVLSVLGKKFRHLMLPR